jgi:hypothetical protein
MQSLIDKNVDLSVVSLVFTLLGQNKLMLKMIFIENVNSDSVLF